MRAIAAAEAGQPAQLALAWVLHRGDDVVPIPGTTRRGHLEQNLAAAEINLSDERPGAARRGGARRGSTAGDRYADMSVGRAAERSW